MKTPKEWLHDQGFAVVEWPDAAAFVRAVQVDALKAAADACIEATKYWVQYSDIAASTTHDCAQRINKLVITTEDP